MDLPSGYNLYKNSFEKYLVSLSDNLSINKELQFGMKYSLNSGGKRVRPVLLLAVFDEVKKGYKDKNSFLNEIDPLPCSLAIEMIHTYSLIHDDLPAMDNDDLRRGKPTLHVKKSEALAILTGDALLTQSFILLSEAYFKFPALSLNLIKELSQSGFKMVEGQVWDTVIESQTDQDLNQLHQIVDYKTGSLLKSSLVLGGFLSFSDLKTLKNLEKLGLYMGRIFQIIDDILDVKGKKEKLGKTIGKDEKQNKLTWVSLSGFEKAERLADEYGEKSKELLSVLNFKSPFFYEFIDFLLNRKY
jgi:geranylgeranyl diphosphate synthase, type II